MSNQEDNLHFRVGRLEQVVEEAMSEIKDAVKEIRDFNKTLSQVIAKQPVHEDAIKDHEVRMRDIEAKVAQLPSKGQVEELQKFMWKVLGVLAVIGFLGFPTTVYFLTHVGK